MSFPGTYAAIKALIRKWALQTRNARAIVRKSGFRIGSAAGEAIPGPILSLPGARRVPLFAPVLHCGQGKNFAVTDSGAMYGWGRDNNAFGIPGAANSSGIATYPSPTRMHAEITDGAQFATTEDVVICVREDGRAFADIFGTTPALGDEHWVAQPETSLQSTPNTTAPWTDVVMAAATPPGTINFAHQKYLLRSDGTVWGRGSLMPGAVGASDAYEVPGFTFTGTLGNWTKLSVTKLGGEVVSIAAQNNRLIFLRADGVVGTWDHGDADPITVDDAPANIVKMTGGGGCIHVLTSQAAGGEIWSAGSNSVGQAGILASSSTTALNALSNALGTSAAAFRKTIGDGYTDVAATGSASFGVRGGRLYSWGIGGVVSARGAGAGIWGAPVEITNPDVDDVTLLHHGSITNNGMYLSASEGVHIWGRNTFSFFGVGALGQGYLSGPDSGIPIPLRTTQSYPPFPLGG